MPKYHPPKRDLQPKRKAPKGKKTKRGKRRLTQHALNVLQVNKLSQLLHAGKSEDVLAFADQVSVLIHIMVTDKALTSEADTIFMRFCRVFPRLPETEWKLKETITDKILPIATKTGKPSELANLITLLMALSDKDERVKNQIFKYSDFIRRVEELLGRQYSHHPEIQRSTNGVKCYIATMLWSLALGSSERCGTLLQTTLLTDLAKLLEEKTEEPRWKFVEAAFSYFQEMQRKLTVEETTSRTAEDSRGSGASVSGRWSPRAIGGPVRESVGSALPTSEEFEALFEALRLG